MRGSTKLLLCLFLTVCNPLANSALAQESDSRPLEMSGITWGTVSWSVIAFAPADREPLLQESIESVFDRVNDQMSTFQPDSEISRFNASQSLDWFEVSPETALVVARAQEISAASAGAFDITVGPLVNLWNFGPDKTDIRIPDATSIQAIQETTGFQHLKVRGDPPALKKSKPELQIDLSAIAKGYAVDLIAEQLQRLDVDSCLVEVGGEVRAWGEKPDNVPWTVGVEKPVALRRDVWSVIELHHKSMASSGDYRKFYDIDGQRFSHTIDPRTGRPVTGGPTAVSVIAADCMTADAIATAVMVCGKDKGLALARTAGVELLVLMPSPEAGEFFAAQSENWPTNLMANRTTSQPEAASIFRTIAVASVFFLIAVIAMSVGVLFGRQRIRGSCGGIANLDNPDADVECSVCSAPSNECRELKKAIKARNQADAAGIDD